MHHRTSAARDALDEMLADMSSASELYKPTQFWQAALAPLIEELSSEALHRFRSMPGPLDFFVPTYGFPGYHADPETFTSVRAALDGLRLSDRRCLSHLERLLSGEAQAEADFRVLVAADEERSPFLSRFSESSVGAPLEQFTFDGRRFSRSSLNYLTGLAFLKRHCDTSQIRAVVEIGAGFGSLGEILLTDPRNECFYVDVDIPPTVHAATYYLSRVFGDDAVLDYRAAKSMDVIDLKQVSRSHRAAAIATWQLPKVTGLVDLFVNFISFQEMEPAVVRNYLAHVDRLQSRYVLLRNLREGKAKARSANDVGVQEPIRGEMYDGFLDRYRLRATNTVPFGYRTVDGFHSELRLYERAD
jgi:putative sugar O-methyltransferase